MTEKLIEGNKLIAEFMGCYGSPMFAGNEEVFRYGFKDTHITERWHESQFAERTPYHTSWDWLMPVCKKFDSLFITDENINKEWVTVKGKKGTIVGKRYVSHCDCIDHALSLYDIKKLWDVVVDAITWYNNQPKRPLKLSTMATQKTAMQELIEYCLSNSDKELIPGSVGSRDMISIEKFYTKATELLELERKQIETAYNRGDSDRDNQQDYNDRDFKNCIHYYTHTYTK